MQAVFIVGTQRSGSNLLRLMLDQSTHISALHPPHILSIFFPLLPLYGDLDEMDNFTRLAEDVSEYVARNPVPWAIRPNVGEMITHFPSYKANIPSFGNRQEMAADRNLQSAHALIFVMQEVYAQAAAHVGAEIWCCKSMANVHLIPLLHSAMPEAKYIHLYRDGRDVGLSFTKAIVGEKHWYALAKQWQKDQEAALASKQNIRPENWFEIRYETFILEPEETLRKLCDFLAVPYQAQMMQYFQSQESKQTAEAGEMWANVLRPVMKDNTRKFLQEVSPENIRIFESVAGETLEKLGYETMFPQEERLSFSPEVLAQFEQENQVLKQAIRSKIRPEDLQKRQGQESLVAEIKARAVVTE